MDIVNGNWIRLQARDDNTRKIFCSSMVSTRLCSDARASNIAPNTTTTAGTQIAPTLLYRHSALSEQEAGRQASHMNSAAAAFAACP